MASWSKSTLRADGWDIGLGLALLDAKAKDIPSPSGVLRERDMVAALDVAANASVRYEWPMLGGKTAILGTVTYQDENPPRHPERPRSFEDGYTVGNLRLSYANDSSPWEIAAFVDNAHDEQQPGASIPSLHRHLRFQPARLRQARAA